METVDAKEPRPSSNPHDKLLSFMADMQSMVDRHVLELALPLEDLSGEDLQRLTDRLNSYLSFEIESEEIEGDVLVCVNGDGILLAVDKEDGSSIGSELIDRGDVVAGMVTSVLVRPVPTINALLDAQAGSKSTSFAVMLSVVAVVENGMFYTGIDNDGNASSEVDLSQHDLHIALVYQFTFKPVALVTQQ